MFGEDRFGPEHDYAATYRRFGGHLPSGDVRRLIQASYDHLDARYPDPAYHDCFLTVREALRALPEAGGLGNAELDRLERTFAAHELGRIPPTYAAAIKRLAQTYRLGLVADVWSEQGPWLDELRRADVHDLFEALVFSSEVGSVKPSPRPFRIAVERMGARPADVLVIGDSARRDISGAKAAGLAALWIGQGTPPAGAVPDLLDLVG